MDLAWDFALRLFLAGVMGILIGLEREYRAKEAGYRTHFLVALGSALLMIVSQYGFRMCWSVIWSASIPAASRHKW